MCRVKPGSATPSLANRFALRLTWLNMRAALLTVIPVLASAGARAARGEPDGGVGRADDGTPASLVIGIMIARRR